MRKIAILSLVILVFSLGSEAQLSKLVKKLTNRNLPLTNTEIVNGLKEALLVATDSSVAHLSAVEGYLKDLTVKILLPPEAKQITDHLSIIPGGEKLVNDVIRADSRNFNKPIVERINHEMESNGRINAGPDGRF